MPWSDNLLELEGAEASWRPAPPPARSSKCAPRYRPDENQFFHDLTGGLPQHPPRILNDCVVDRPLPLRRCQLDGVIIATGWSSLPTSYRDEDLVAMRLTFVNQDGYEIECEITGRVDRSIKRKHDRRRQERSRVFRPRVGAGLFELANVAAGIRETSLQKNWQMELFPVEDRGLGRPEVTPKTGASCSS